ncbi:MAG: starch-binding protein, partial [Bacteroidales bacterium]|nr:starch-binding protein [Bacteroidales bacterium]
AFNSEGASNLLDENYIIEENQEYAIQFKNTSNWNDVYIYLFDIQANAPINGWKWPGKLMKKEGNSPWYSYSVNASGDVGIVFNNNAGKQSKDLVRNTEGWYHFGEDVWYDTCPGNCPGDKTDELTIYFNNNKLQWNSVKLYYWNTTPKTASIGWPGINMTDADGDGWFEYTIYGAKCANVIFSQNGNPQTGDLYVCDEGYYDNGWVDPISLKSGIEFITNTSDLEITPPFPNPVNNYINFRINKENTDVDVKLLSASGQVLMQNKMFTSDGKVQIPVDLQKGTYVLQIQCNNHLQSFKVLK